MDPLCLPSEQGLHRAQPALRLWGAPSPNTWSQAGSLPVGSLLRQLGSPGATSKSAVPLLAGGLVQTPGCPPTLKQLQIRVPSRGPSAWDPEAPFPFLPSRGGGLPLKEGGTVSFLEPHCGLRALAAAGGPGVHKPRPLPSPSPTCPALPSVTLTTSPRDPRRLPWELRPEPSQDASSHLCKFT